jgi:FAD/FMN-containing dehydrogenase
MISRGLGRSYGDSSLSSHVFDLQSFDHFLEFDSEKGFIRCEAGVSFATLLQFLVPRGWFLPVTPGTKFVTVGGAIASDVHGKNHHKEGTFCDHVLELKLLLADGTELTCSPQKNSEAFHATCGGMGLTGIVTQATFQLKKISSAWIDQTTFKTADLAETYEHFHKQAHQTYSVAWIDCLTRGRNMGRSLLMVGDHSKNAPSNTTEPLVPGGNPKLTLPFDFPAIALNPFTIQAFNALYYNRVQGKITKQNPHYEPFFYPLDSIHHWNRMYGKSGFTQYQFVLPQSAGQDAMSEILDQISHAKKGSFLAVLKAFGPENKNYLSFPLEGFTLALDFKMERGLLELLNSLDEKVLNQGGRIYLSKDARMSEKTFKDSYPRWNEFARIRKDLKAHRFRSLQSERLGIDR